MASHALGRVQALRHRRLGERERWERTLSAELDFWRGFFGDPARYAVWPRFRPGYSLSDLGLAWVGDRLPSGRVTVLDVGAGPLTSLPRKHAGITFEVTAFDPLAHEYDALLADVELERWVHPQPGTAETLLDHVEPGSFDLAYASNSLDHGYDPVLAIRNMVAAVKPGGLVLLRHKRNEGRTADYRGLHQWNFDVEDGDFVVWRPGTRRNLTKELADVATGEISLLFPGWITWLGERRR